MRVDSLKSVAVATEARLVADLTTPSEKALPAAAEADLALDRLKARVDAAPPGSLETPERQIKRTLQLQEGGRLASRSELERTLGRDDLVDLNYLQRGLDAARSVGRITLRDAGGRRLGEATGVMISPDLLLTNHHVLPDAGAATASWVEFGYELDVLGFPTASTTFALDPAAFFHADPALDYAVVAVGGALKGDQALSGFGWLRLSPETGKINIGEPVTIIQHPDGRPKQIALRKNDLLDITENHLTYESDTAPGSSGAPVFNDSWQIVGLHHSGVPRKDAQGRWLRVDGQPATDEDDDSVIDWLSNEGVRASRIANALLALEPGGVIAERLKASCLGTLQPDTATPHVGPLPRRDRMEARAEAAGPASHPVPSSIVRVPLTLQIAVTVEGGAMLADGVAVRTADAVERTVEPWHETDYANRTGYDSDFLGLKVALPEILDPDVAAGRIDGGPGVVLPYQNFSVIMHAARRICLFTASNVDGSDAAKRPDPSRTYSRDALGGLGENDFEKWFTDPRIAPEHQLSDGFFNKDRKAFDKGHVVRREEVCWGRDYDQVRRANGDTYHITNCTPQVGDFNRSNLKGIWGLLENLIQAQAEVERYCLFAGPILKEDDPVFVGSGDGGSISVRIPRAYWKVVVARAGQSLQTFGFVLEQDLSRVAWEFDVPVTWRPRMIALATLQDRIGLIRFPKAVLKADRFATAGPV